MSQSSDSAMHIQGNYVPQANGQGARDIKDYTKYLRDSIQTGTTWTMHEPNGERLWSAMSAAVTKFLTEEWRKGNLAGASPGEAFTVTCSAVNNTFTAEQLVCDVAVAIERPRDFVAFQITSGFDRPQVG
ncbi:phage tail sheath C-terminal domain-containing protein [Streptomyces chattanoogensis]